jgi:3-hydroxyacyl-CoA dehydrogenase
VEGSGIANADVVIEAIFEDLNAKRELFARIEPKLKPSAVLATTSRFRVSPNSSSRLLVFISSSSRLLVFPSSRL